MARLKTDVEIRQLKEQREHLNTCSESKWCSCIKCFEARNPHVNQPAPQTYDPSTYLENYCEDNDYDVLAYFNKK